MTTPAVLDKLKAFDIQQQDIELWETELGLDIPVRSDGLKDYSPLHVNLFKNIKKHLILGRSLEDIKRLIILPKSVVSSTPQEIKSDRVGMARPHALAQSPDRQRQSQAAQEAALEAQLAQEIAQQDIRLSVAQPTQSADLEAARSFDEALRQQAESSSSQAEASNAEEAIHLAKADQSLSGRVALELVEQLEAVGKQTVAGQAPEGTDQAFEIDDATLQIDLSGDPQDYVSPVIAAGAGKPSLGERLSSELDRNAYIENALGYAVSAEPDLEADRPGYVDPSGDVGSNMLLLVDRLMKDKDAYQRKITELEKLNAHLHQSNHVFQDKIDELTQVLETSQDVQGLHREATQLLNDKSSLQRRLIDFEQRYRSLEHNYQAVLEQLEVARKQLNDTYDSKLFLGQWLEEATLQQVVFDNFGVSIEPERQRLFKVSSVPQRVFGPTAVFEQTFDYPSNPLWKRAEMMLLSIEHDERLVGELVVEYILDETPVARAIYSVVCTKK